MPFIRSFRIILCVAALMPPLFNASAQINTDQVINVGRNALYFEDYVLSIQYFNQVIAAKPYLAQPYFLRALAKYNLDDLDGAEKDVSTAIEHNPFIVDAYELRGVVHQNKGELEKALADYNHALDMLPENRSLLFNKSMALVDLKRYDEAATTFSTLLTRFPRFEEGYIGKARLHLAQSDTVGALENADKALAINKNSINAHLLKAEVNMNGNEEKMKDALAHMDEAIRLNPKHAGFFINRAFLRYKLNDYFGAMSDYDYAVQLDPENFVAHFNRGMLCAEVRDYNKALDDFNEVLRVKPQEYRTLYNRSLIYRERNEYKKALADISAVIDAFPSLAAAYFLRYDIKRSMGDRSAQRDLDKSLALAKQRIRIKGKKGASDTSDLFGTPEVSDNVKSSPSDDATEAQEVVAARFTSLLTVNNNLQTGQEFNNKSIRGKVQDRNLTIDTEPLISLTYFISPTDLKPSSDYIKEIEEVNRTRALRFVLQASNHEVIPTDTLEINRHFESIAYYNSYLSNHKPRAIDYFGRAMDQMTLRNYESANADFSKAVEMSPEFTLGYFMRAIAQYRLARQADAIGSAENSRPGAGNSAELRRASLSKIIADIDKVIKLAPSMAAAHYNKGTIMLENDDLTSAISSLNKAIELKPDFGEAYYNRGYAYLKLGNREAGLADLSKAGELGIVPSYSVLKRMNR